MGASRRSNVGETMTRVGAVGDLSDGFRDVSYPGQFESIYGTAGATTLFGLGVLRYMKELITVDDVLNSRMVCYPFHLLECCLVADGGGALILTSTERVSDFPKKPVYILGTGESVETPIVSQMYDMTYSTAFRVSSPSGI